MRRIAALLAIAAAPMGTVALGSLTRARASELDAATWMPQDLVIVGICGFGAALCAYLTAIAVAMAVGSTRGTLPRWSSRLAPHAWRRMVALGIGVTLSSTAPAAFATPPDEHAGWVSAESSYALADALATARPGAVPADDGLTRAGWTGTGDVDASPMAVHAPTPKSPGSAVERDEGTRVWTVRAGDSLWGITADHLPADATDAEIAEAWPLVHQANRELIGDDPGLIHPGQVLSIPDEVSR